jgi:sugar/nucleoside kinase (ribokinase family)
LRKQAQAKNVLLEIGEEGPLIHSWDSTRGDIEGGIMTYQVLALNAHPKDVAGAGDSLLIAGTMAMACGANIWEAICVGSLAAAIQVGPRGSAPLQIDELNRVI